MGYFPYSGLLICQAQKNIYILAIILIKKTKSLAMKLLFKLVCIYIILLAFWSENSIAQKKKYCYVYFDEKQQETDSTYSITVISNIFKVKKKINTEVKTAFAKKYNLKYGNLVVDTSQINLIFADTKSEASDFQKKFIQDLKGYNGKQIKYFCFEFEYEFSFEFNYNEYK